MIHGMLSRRGAAGSRAPEGPSGIALPPHSGQNFALGDSFAPQWGHERSPRGAPHSLQNLPVPSAPQEGHIRVAVMEFKARGVARALLRGLTAAVIGSALPAGAVFAQGFGSVAGVVRTESGEPVADAQVLLAGRRQASDSAGRFLHTAVPAGDHRMEVRRVGFRPVSLVIAIRAGDTVRVEVRIVELPVQLPGITAQAESPERRRFEREAQTSSRSLDVRDIAAVPSLIESDLMRTVQLLPGVVSRSDYSVGLNVRGGDADQNLVLLDGQVVFNPFHLGGLLSTFPDQMVQGLDFLAGGFPARYGGRLSSVLDITGRTGRGDRHHGSASVSLLSTRVHAEGPLPGGSGSWIAAARRTYADQLVAVLTAETFPYHFQDLLGRVTVNEVAGGTLSLIGFLSGDYFNFLLAEGGTTDEQTFRFDWGNRVAGLTWRRVLGPGVTYTQRAGVSGFFADIAVGPGLVSFTNRLTRYAVSGDLEAERGAHHWALGYLADRHDVVYSAASGDADVQLGRLDYAPRAFEAYAEDQWRPRPWLLLRPGARLTHVSGIGFTRVAPRAALKAFVDPATAVTVSGGRYYQYVHSLRNEEIPVSLFEFWVGADRHVPVSEADQVVLGVERWLSETTSLQVEAFWKEMRNLIDGDPEEDPGLRGDEFLLARGTAYGLDLYLRRTAGRVKGWVSYTLGRVTRTLETGERFAPGQDRRHQLNAVAMFDGPLGAEWTVRFGYGSPLPYTAIAGQWVHRFYDPGRNIFIGAFTEPYRTERNSRRYPAYSRLDISATWRFSWLGARWSPSVSLLNAYARTNVFVYFYNYDRVPPVRRGFSQLPFLPTVGVEVEW